MIVDYRTKHMAVVKASDRAVLDVPPPAPGLPGRQPGSYTTQDSAVVAGLPCTDWQTADAAGQPTLLCLTADGVMLRASQKGQVLLEATAVSYGPQDPAVFRARPARCASSRAPSRCDRADPSDAAPVRERVNPRRPRSTHPMQKTPWPWHDRSGRFSWLKTVGAGRWRSLPALWIAFALARTGSAPGRSWKPIHQTGLWAIRFLMLTLLATPARAIFNWHRLVLVRRQLGLTALFYTLAHLVLYAWDEKWILRTVAMEILQRFYLEVGFVALVGLAAAGRHLDRPGAAHARAMRGSGCTG